MIIRGLLGLLAALLTLSAAVDVNCTQNANCSSCINGTFSLKCAWCSESSTCLPYDPTSDIKDLKGCTGSFYASNCVVNHMMVLVGVGIAGAVVLLAIAAVTLWCCCCRGRKARKKKMLKEELQYQRQRDAISTKHEASRAERQEKNDAIRVKYGLKKNTAYEQFD